MKTYYCVKDTEDSWGVTEAYLYKTIDAEECPKRESKSFTLGLVRYKTDFIWFESKAEAMKYIKEVEWPSLPCRW